MLIYIATYEPDGEMLCSSFSAKRALKRAVRIKRAEGFEVHKSEFYVTEVDFVDGDES